MRVRVKICGLTRAADVDAAVGAGADAVGFVLSDSPRRVEPEHAAELARRAPPHVAKVAVLRHPSAALVERALAAFAWDRIQCEPDEVVVDRVGRARLLPVFHDEPDLLEQVERWFDADAEARGPIHFEGAGRGGRGVSADRSRARALARRCRLVLAGGLTPAGVAEAIAEVRPWGVDVSSGVEIAPGIKDEALVRAFVAAVRRTTFGAGAGEAKR